MLEYIFSLNIAHAALFVSVLALLVGLRSTSIAEKSRRFTQDSARAAERYRAFEKRTEILSEVDRQHARFGTLLYIVARKVILFQNSPILRERYPLEYDRLTQNLDAIEILRSRYEKQRGISEQIGEGTNLAKQEEILAEIRKLSIHLNEDITKEEHHLDELRKALEENMA